MLRPREHDFWRVVEPGAQTDDTPSRNVHSYRVVNFTRNQSDCNPRPGTYCNVSLQRLQDTDVGDAKRERA